MVATPRAILFNNHRSVACELTDARQMPIGEVAAIDRGVGMEFVNDKMSMRGRREDVDRSPVTHVAASFFLCEARERVVCLELHTLCCGNRHSSLRKLILRNRCRSTTLLTSTVFKSRTTREATIATDCRRTTSLAPQDSSPLQSCRRR